MAYSYPYDEEEKKVVIPRLKTDRALWKYILFSILTLGIYQIVFFIPFSFDLDKVDPKRDGKRTMNFFIAWLLSLFTFSLVLFAWHYHVAGRVEEAIENRKLSIDFGTGTFWLWYVLGSLILIGPFVYFYKLFRAMNLLCEDYNEKTPETM